MKKLLLLTLLLTYGSLHAQNISEKNMIRFSVGRVAYGTGDYFGISFGTEYSRKLAKHFSVGAEASMESGSKHPSPKNVYTSFYHVSNTALTLKLNYFPFNRIIKGFNIGVGPTFGYQNLSETSQYMTYYQNNVPVSRSSVITYGDQWFSGYRVSLNYDLFLKRGLLFGLRCDFANYSNGDINTTIGGKIGVAF
jgi:hypothetical protein